MSTLFRDVRVFDGAEILDAASVLVENGRIALVAPPGADVLAPSDAVVVEEPDATLLPGLIDCHVHAEPGALREAITFGVTTVLDMMCPPELHREQRATARRDLGMADVLSAGIGATAPGGHPSQLVESVDWLDEFPTLSTPGEAADFVARRMAEGSQYLKIFAGRLTPGDGRPCLDTDTVAALVEAARTNGVLSIAHAVDQAAARAAVAAGVDGLAHLFVDEKPEPPFIDEIVSAGVFVVPTLTMLESLCGRPSGAELARDPRITPFLSASAKARLESVLGENPELDLSHAREAVAMLAAAGGTLLAGTDAIAHGTAHGASLHRELELLVECGMSPRQALAAATSAPAGRFGLSDRGHVRGGLQADLVLVRGNPAEDITRTRDLIGVWRRGQRVERRRQPAIVDREG
ncbi:amidohydrolase family protein [Actinophytocola oryzae]|uniref:Imidazolonepropionase-like amidohydrolase n=1 Tax=Actinophytocola oryzae TaxID=502181 RepID=A0A4R7UTV6_9PSEU|nr:amidohydrolase family protein [Actinophytocola oryzae]TDV38599.1 imidazolonepropionase-like amidohydrolase [Actinophytocola oryzae]